MLKNFMSDEQLEELNLVDQFDSLCKTIIDQSAELTKEEEMKFQNILDKAHRMYEFSNDFSNFFGTLSEEIFFDDYIWPETGEDDIIYSLGSGFTAESLKEFCNSLHIPEQAWDNVQLYDFLWNMFSSNRQYFDCGGATPVVAALIYIQYYGEITRCNIDFTHDKWEARGDYQREHRIGIHFNEEKGIFEIVHVSYEPYDDMDEDDDEEDTE